MNSKVKLVIRILLGVFMLFFGLNKYAEFITIPPAPGVGGELMDIYIESGFMGIVAALEIVAGLALIIGRYIPIALTVIIAIMVNATLFHVFHDPASVGGSAIGLVLALLLMFGYKDKFGTYFNV
jgi:putative oxidoreductase